MAVSTTITALIASTSSRVLYPDEPATYLYDGPVGTRPGNVVYYDIPLGRTFTDISTGQLWGYVTPFTNRQPTFTAEAPLVNWNREIGTQGTPLQLFYYLHKAPIIVSFNGSHAPTSLIHMNRPHVPLSLTTEVVATIVTVTITSSPFSSLSSISSAFATAAASITVPPRKERKRQAMSIDSPAAPSAATGSGPTIYGATRTETFYTTITATPGDVVYIPFPTLTTPEPVEYTTIPVSASINRTEKVFPNGQPILVLTEVDAAVFNPTINDIAYVQTLLQAPPPPPTEDPRSGKIALANPSWKWDTWTTAEKAGVVGACIVAFFATGTLLIWLCLERHRRRKREDAEKGSGTYSHRNKPSRGKSRSKARKRDESRIFGPTRKSGADYSSARGELGSVRASTPTTSGTLSNNNLRGSGTGGWSSYISNLFLASSVRATIPSSPVLDASTSYSDNESTLSEGISDVAPPRSGSAIAANNH